ncbi:TPA: immunoglobulin domain-containing protein [Citrobacter koseri]|uniref:phage tail tube protein n=1 Tax=Citrobacter koseri TaxID=545 RepID=UPI0019023F80|nr:phage tail tube protein [Citrobacter koseri]EKW1005619.1 immunoglobulin domain-containing protein [Citrobacter koseri]MBJ8938571.1 immunoglobulin domain-containing protein [Citrobacter koseri]MBJ9068759.1 immunoglobulin domain-containing protein [Citrobacter koseri]HEM6838293.1 immunoglobulin domain-containing protein [Citrobacter koseri]HEM7954773.1 immunoglobulin domain-containing protein [Citrobacter koseri]
MACEAGAFTGRDVVVYYAISCPEVQPSNGDYTRLGMMRGKTTGAEWETADATADMSAAFTQENLVTYKNISFSGDGVTRKEDVYAQNALKRHVYNPPAETSNQPYVWLKIISPNDITEGPFMVTSWQDEAPHDDVATWSIEASSAGSVDVRDVGAVITITAQPQNRTLTVGDALNLSVSATVSDGSVLTYQWKHDGEDISGATSATYTKASVTEDDAGAYTCQITSTTAGSLTSGAATVIVNAE